jgi:glutamate racemase
MTNSSCAFTHLQAPIICIDSGIGGVHVLKYLADAIQAPFIYIADYAGFPYGEKSPHTLRTRLVALLERLYLTHTPAMVVLACNTATTVAIHLLRQVFPELDFVGCIPAIKPAAQRTKNGIIALLATPSTCKQLSVHALIQEYQQQCEILRFPLKELASVAEQYFLDEQHLAPQELAQLLAPLLNHPDSARIDQVVLGCTHYPFLLSPMQKIGHQHWNWIDSSQAVAQQALRLWKKHPAQSEKISLIESPPLAPLIHFVYTIENKNKRPLHPSPQHLEHALKRFGLDTTPPQPWLWLKDPLRLSSNLPTL